MMDFQSAMETFAEAWVAANTKTTLTDLTTQVSKIIFYFRCYIQNFLPFLSF